LNRADGSVAWELDLGGPIELPPAYADGRLYVRTADGRLHAVD
jgi:outer membrane protein assembly factor BamB